jgi:hypothetical protein
VTCIARALTTHQIKTMAACESLEHSKAVTTGRDNARLTAPDRR